MVGDVEVGEDSSIWYNTVIRAELSKISIGKRTNIQDNCTIHTEDPLKIGDDVSVGHNAIVHGCTIEDQVIVGMHSTILNRAVIGTGSIVGAGTLVKEGTIVPPGSLIVGVPGKIVKSGDTSMLPYIKQNAKIYLNFKEAHQRGDYKIYSKL
uniref:Gamma carbonic anhydrase family protein n=1 Tax=Arcella intermedia TaxID=1963864 RepID=A0A6B2LM75_9EUKA